MKSFTTKSPQKTQGFAQHISQSLQGGDILCLHGNLGSGKTTFTQGLLKSFGAQKPYTSPTFLIMKEYSLRKTKSKKQNTEHTPIESDISTIYHIDAYRIGSNDMQLLGWEELIQNKHALLIIEWPEKIHDIIPEYAQWFHFEWIDDSTRKITQKETLF